MAWVKMTGIFAGFVLLLGCVGATRGPVRIRIQGSDTMLLLTRMWAEEYMKSHPGTAVYAEGGGTRVGAAALADGGVDICAASRPLLPEEVKRLADNSGVIGLSTRVAKDALSVYVHPENTIQDLDMDQLRRIFSGQVTNWRDVGGEDLAIELVIRTPASGTFQYFRDHVLAGTQYGHAARIAATTEQVVRFVAQHKGAIGYGGMAYGSDVVHCAINGVQPTTTNVINGTYPLTRYLFLYTQNLPRGEVKSFLDWVLRTDNQELVRRVGYFPIWSP